MVENSPIQACSFVEVDLNRTDSNFKDEVAPRTGRPAHPALLCLWSVQRPLSCRFAIRKVFDPRRMIRKIILGLRDEVLQSELPLAVFPPVFTCQETCPQGVGFTEVLFAVKNIAVREGYFPPALAIQPELLKDHGRLLEITDFENDKRAELGLPKLEEKIRTYARSAQKFQGQGQGRGRIMSLGAVPGLHRAGAEHEL